MTTDPKHQAGMTTKTLTPFLILTFALTWGIAALLILFTDQVVAVFGEISASNPLYILAVYAPGIVGVLLVWQKYGLKGLVSFFRRLTLGTPSTVVVVIAPGYSCQRLPWRCTERYHQ